MKTLFKSLKNHECCVISNGKVFVFNLSGNCIKEDIGLIPDYLDFAIGVNIVSLIQSKGVVELAVDLVDGSFRKFEVDVTAQSIIMSLTLKKGFSHILNRTGTVEVNSESISFSQALFVYPENFDILSLLGNNFALREVY